LPSQFPRRTSVQHCNRFFLTNEIFKKMKFLLTLSFLVFFALEKNIAQGNAPMGTIKGIVMDEKTQETMPGVTVAVDGLKKGATTNMEGGFIITDLSAGEYGLTVSFIGYTSKSLMKLTIDPNAVLDVGKIGLAEAGISLREVTVSPGNFSILGNNNLSRQTLTEKDLKNMSWAEDITRAVSRLPGVSSTDFSSKFTIRGGEADEVLMTLDGMELYEPFHQRDFVGGLFSIVDIETIQGIDLMTGGFSAEFGQRQSGVFQMRTKHIKDNEQHTSVGLSVMNARLYTDGTFAKNKGSYLFSARRGMLDLLFKAIGRDESLPSFWDAMGKVEYKLNEKNVLSFHVLQAGDKAAIRDIKPDNFDIHDTKYNNSYGWLTLKTTLNRDVFVRSMLYSGYITHHRKGQYHKRDYSDKGDFNLLDKRKYAFFGAKQDWNIDMSKRIALKTGFDFRQLNADYDYSNSLTEIRVNAQDSLYTFSRNVDIQTKPSGQLANIYLTGKVLILPKLIGEAGIRYDIATYAQDKVWSPRLGLAYSFSKSTVLRAAWGQYYQSQFINNLDVNHNGTAFNPAELSTHYVLGFEHTFPKGLSLRLETYYKDISHISPIYQNLRDPWEVFPESRNDVVKLLLNGAAAQGLEAFLKYDMGKKISWWFSYSLAKAEDDIRDIEFDGIFIEKTGKQLRPNNQFHTIYADVNYRLNNKWHFSLSWQFYKGWPRTTYTYDFQKLPDNNTLGQETAALLPEGSLHFYQRHELFNGVQYPAYHRMDIRVNRHFKTTHGRISAFAHFINVYNQFNLRKFDLGVANDTGLLTPDGNGRYVISHDNTHWFGITPVIGASWEF